MAAILNQPLGNYHYYSYSKNSKLVVDLKWKKYIKIENCVIIHILTAQMNNDMCTNDRTILKQSTMYMKITELINAKRPTYNV